MLPHFQEPQPFLKKVESDNALRKTSETQVSSPHSAEKQAEEVRKRMDEKFGLASMTNPRTD